MSGNTFGRAFKVTTFGESHGAGLGAVVDGCPAGLQLSEEDVQAELDRRRPGQSALTTKRSEPDHAEILSGVFEGRTTGAPIAMIVRNKDADSSAYDAIKDLPRPGHADYGYMAKFGLRDHRGGGRSSGRETLSRVAAGAVAKKLLALKDIYVYAHTTAIHHVEAGEVTLDEIINNTYRNPVRCADLNAAPAMEEAIRTAQRNGESVGGVIEAVAVGVPAGIGSPVFAKLDADLAGALMGIGAVKGVEIGVGFEAAHLVGSEMNDEFYMDGDVVRTRTNHAGGILGGISTGMPIICRLAVKPTPSVSRPQQTVNLRKNVDAVIEIKGRHDPSIVPRAVPVVEAMISLVLADHMIMSGRISPDKL
ncbi:MAG TPA: chorismate synthase [Methanocellaceae archaeon]